MIHAAPLDHPHSLESYPAALRVMRANGVSLLATEKVFDILRDYSESDWSSVLHDLKHDAISGRWFNGGNHR